MQDLVADLLQFIDRSPTPYHAVATAVSLLEEAGYAPLEEAEIWSVSPGDRRYVVRAGGARGLRDREPTAREAGFRIAGAHTIRRICA